MIQEYSNLKRLVIFVLTSLFGILIVPNRADAQSITFTVNRDGSFVSGSQNINGQVSGSWVRCSGGRCESGGTFKNHLNPPQIEVPNIPISPPHSIPNNIFPDLLDSEHFSRALPYNDYPQGFLDRLDSDSYIQLSDPIQSESEESGNTDTTRESIEELLNQHNLDYEDIQIHEDGTVTITFPSGILPNRRSNFRVEWISRNSDNTEIARSIVETCVTISKGQCFKIGTGGVVSRTENEIFIITARHVLENENNQITDQISVRFRRGSFENPSYFESQAKLVAIHNEYDLALLKVENFPYDIKVLKISNESPKVDTLVHAIGHPEGGFPWSREEGRISNLGEDNGHNVIQVSGGNFVRGFSGGLVLDKDNNEILGIFYQSHNADGMLNHGFAYRNNIIMKVLKEWNVFLDQNVAEEGDSAK